MPKGGWSKLPTQYIGAPDFVNLRTALPAFGKDAALPLAQTSSVLKLNSVLLQLRLFSPPRGHVPFVSVLHMIRRILDRVCEVVNAHPAGASQRANGRQVKSGELSPLRQDGSA